MSGVGKRTYLRDVNPYLICPLCRGYLIDATTVVECLHSFCRSCILKHLNAEAHCPSCKHDLNKAKPNIKADKALQDIVYKLVPGLYHKEMRRRREFYKKHPEHAELATPEQRGEDVSGRLIFAPEDAVSLSLEYLPPGADPVAVGPNDDTNNLNISNNQNEGNNSNNNSSNSSNNHNGNISNRRYLQCPALVTIAHLKKFLALKYSVDMTRYTIEICHRRRAPLPENWTLMDVAYIYAWKRNAPMRFFYRVALEEQRLEAPPHDRPSTPGLGASLPPVDVVIAQSNSHPQNAENDTESKPEVKRINNANKESALDNQNTKVVSEKSRLPTNQVPTNKSKEKDPKEKRPSSNAVILPPAIAVSTSKVNSTSTVSVTSTVASPTSNGENKQSKTPIKILKNSEGRYEVLKSPPYNCDTKEEVAASTETKSSNTEFSVVSIGSGQNSNGVKITLKQCSPNNTSSNKPTVISNVLLRSSHIDKDSVTSALMLQQLQKEKEEHQIEKQEKQQVEKQEKQQVEKQGKQQVEKREKQQVERKGEQQAEKQEKQQIEKREKQQVEKQEKQQVEKQEKQRRRVTFMERMTPEKTTAGNVLKSIQKKLGEQEKKQFLQGFQLTARESVSEIALKSSSKSNERSATNVLNSVQGKMNITSKKEDNVTTETRSSVGNVKSKNNSGNISVNSSTSNRFATASGTGNARVNVNKPYSDVDTCTLNYSKNTNEAMNIIANSTSSTTVFQFNDLTVVPAGAVKRKCPPGVPLFDIKRKKQHHIPTPTAKKQPAAPAPPVVQDSAKSPRKIPTDQVTVRRTTNAIGEAGPSRTPATSNSKSSSSPALSNDTRNILDGCGLNIPASLSITLTAARSPSSNSLFPEPNGSKDNRKSTLGKVNPSITLNDRSVDPRVLKALKAGQIKMPVPPKPKQITHKERDVNQQYHTSPGKRKRDQDSRDILDLSGGKKVDMHPLRIPQPVGSMSPKIKPAPMELPNNTKTQLVTRLDGQRFYQVAPGCNTPARIPDCAIPTPSRTPVYAPSGFLIGPLPNSKSGNLPNLSSVFPSLQSLFALSQQTPNVQRFQIDARLRLPQGTEASSESVDPVKSSQQLSVQTKYSPVTESNNRCSPRSTSNNGNANNENNKPSTEVLRDSNLEINNDSKKESDNTSRQTSHREAASPRVSSTASPSPPPGDTSTSTTNEATNKNRDDSANTNSNGIDNDLPAPSLRKSNNASAEVSSSKSPASPDSSSVTIENRSGKGCTTVEQGLASSSQTSDTSKSSEHSMKTDNNIIEDSANDNDKKACTKQADTKQLTSEMFQKRLLAAFPSDEWANNPIAAEHLGNFLKSLNESIKSENKVENAGSEKVESQVARKGAPCLNNEASSKSRADVAESS